MSVDLDELERLLEGVQTGGWDNHSLAAFQDAHTALLAELKASRAFVKAIREMDIESLFASMTQASKDWQAKMGVELQSAADAYDRARGE